jgi:hypothetical protein
MIEHVDNLLMEIHAGAPEIPRPSRSEDDEIERLLLEHIGNSREDIGDNGDGLEDEFADANAAQPIRWPTQGETPINEYNTEGYIAMAFPTLFPYGRADLRDHSHRYTSLKVAEYFEALLRYKDGRFGTHPR